MDGEITRIAFSAIVRIEDEQDDDFLAIFVYVVIGGVEIYCGIGEGYPSGSDHVWLHFYVPESFKLKEDNDQIQVKFVCESNSKSMVFKSCGFHMVHSKKNFSGTNI